MEVTIVEEDDKNEGQVLQFVLEDGSGESIRLIPVEANEAEEVSASEVANDQTAIGITEVVDGVTYIQIENAQALDAEVGEAQEGAPEGVQEEVTRTPAQQVGEEETHVVEVAEEEGKPGEEEEHHSRETEGGGGEETPEMLCILPQRNYKLELLDSIHADCGKIFDLPVFCQDGVAWTNKILLASLSDTLKSILFDLGQDVDTCLILPELKQLEFVTFHRALFAKENDSSLDFVCLIKVAEMLGSELALTTTFPANEGPFPNVDYRAILENHHERNRVFTSLGFVGTDGGSSKSLRDSSDDVVNKVSKILSTDIVCKTCNRSFVDEEGRKRHFNLLHLPKPLFSVIKNGRSQRLKCKSCKKTFNFAVNLKKHEWLCHQKIDEDLLLRSENPNASVALTAPATILDKVAMKKKRAKEKFEDMKCKVCGAEANTWKQLQIHMMDHTKERPFKCEICSKGFKEPQKLKRHQVIHTGERNHKCSFCGKAFSLRHNMRSHERIHEGKGVFCKFCGKMFSQVTNLRDHEKLHENAKHRVTDDPAIRKIQAFQEKKKGRPSILEMDSKKMQAEKNTSSTTRHSTKKCKIEDYDPIDIS